MYKFLFSVVLLLLIGCTQALPQEFYVDAVKGNDAAAGDKLHPFHSLAKATNVINALQGNGGVRLKLLPGLYHLQDKMELKPKRAFTAKQPLVVEAAIMPDDREWTAASMPVIFCDADTTAAFEFTNCTAILVSCSHVVIQGIKFTGNPNPQTTLYYPIGRADNSLVGLKVAQCMFIGEKYVSPIQVGVLSDGQQTVIDHCIFYNCRNAVVYWRANGIKMNDSMTHCIIYGAYQAGVWTARPDSNFFFSNNIVAHCRFAWIKNHYNQSAYHFQNSLFSANDFYCGQWVKNDSLEERTPLENKLTEINITTSDAISLSDNQTVAMELTLPDDYLNIRSGTAGYDLNAGIFRRRK
jgi:hypothetical protein